MKKILFLIVTVLLVVEFRHHPLLEPYTKKISALVSKQAQKTVGISNFPELLTDLKSLESIISPHEFSFVIEKISHHKQAKLFYGKQCINIELSHMVLTRYAMKKTCSILEGYISSST